ncbi:TPA: hypothetical protein ACT9KU_001194 [Legionella pneumophila]
MTSFFLRKNITKSAKVLLEKEAEKVFSRNGQGVTFLEKGYKVMTYTKHPIQNDDLILAYSPNVIYSNERMNKIREVMRRRQCGFALFRVKEDTFCQVKQLKNYPEDLEARDTSQFFVTSETLEPVKFLESSPPP